MEEKLNMTLEQYKEKVCQCLIQDLKRSVPAAERLMKEYEGEFEELLKSDLPPNAAATGMAMNLL